MENFALRYTGRDIGRIDETCVGIDHHPDKIGKTLFLVIRPFEQFANDRKLSLSRILDEIDPDGIPHAGKYLFREGADRLGDIAPGDDLSVAIKKAFDVAVQPDLERDGGALEIAGIKVDDEYGVTVEVLMLGACASCSSAQGQTLKAAENAVTAMLNIIKDDYKDQADVQQLHLKAIQENSISHGFAVLDKHFRP